jgi:tyrosyl-tRNA synthetase
MAPSTGEGRRMIAGGGVTLDRRKVTDPRAEVDASPGQTFLIQAGKRRYLLVRIAETA